MVEQDIFSLTHCCSIINWGGATAHGTVVTSGHLASPHIQAHDLAECGATPSKLPCLQSAVAQPFPLASSPLQQSLSLCKRWSFFQFVFVVCSLLFAPLPSLAARSVSPTSYAGYWRLLLVEMPGGGVKQMAPWTLGERQLSVTRPRYFAYPMDHQFDHALAMLRIYAYNNVACMID